MNSTANHLVARMNASHGVDEFHRKLLVAVKQVCNMVNFGSGAIKMMILC